MQIHIHARRPDGTPSYEVEDFRAITEAIRAEVGDAAIINYSTGAIGVPRREADRLPARAAARGRRAEHGVDELREVLAQAQGVRVPDASSPTRSTRSSSCCGDERARHQARARVLRPRARRLARAARRHGRAAAAAARSTSSWASSAACRRRARNLAAMADNVPDGLALGRDRHQPRAVDDRRPPRSRSAARSASGSRTTSTCPTATMARSNGDLDRQGAPDDQDIGRRPATVEEARALLGLAPAVLA